uniref:Uncharacterized protein n=1 Tax=Timema genevievae TaxID=629358 RepID=A0A7R9PK14_TIMGE|nr:unnamed protein product [Timema genevievae]
MEHQAENTGCPSKQDGRPKRPGYYTRGQVKVSIDVEMRRLTPVLHCLVRDAVVPGNRGNTTIVRAELMERPAFWRVPHNKPDPGEGYYTVRQQAYKARFHYGINYMISYIVIRKLKLLPFRVNEGFQELGIILFDLLRVPSLTRFKCRRSEIVSFLKLMISPRSLTSHTEIDSMASFVTGIIALAYPDDDGQYNPVGLKPDTDEEGKTLDPIYKFHQYDDGW